MQNDHLEILLESIDSKFQISMEAFSALNEKLDRNHKELSGKIEGFDSRLTRVEAKLGNVENNLVSVSHDLAEHRSNTEMHSTPRKRTLKKVG